MFETINRKWNVNLYSTQFKFKVEIFTNKDGLPIL